MSDKNFAEPENARPYKIARMTGDFIGQVKEIELECGLSPWTIEDYKAELSRDDSIFFIAKTGDKAIGFILARLIMQKEDSISKSENSENVVHRDEAEIYNLAVLKQARNQRVGQALFKRFLEESERMQISDVWLEVRESNCEAIDFYKKNGFRKIHVRRNFYRFPTEDALLMKLELKDAEGA